MGIDPRVLVRPCVLFRATRKEGAPGNGRPTGKPGLRTSTTITFTCEEIFRVLIIFIIIIIILVVFIFVVVVVIFVIIIIVIIYVLVIIIIFVVIIIIIIRLTIITCRN